MAGPIRQTRVRGIFVGQTTHREAQDYLGGVTLPLLVASGAQTNVDIAGTLTLPIFGIAGNVVHNVGDVTIPLFTSAGVGEVGQAIYGNVDVPLFVATGRIAPGTWAAVDVPLFTAAGSASELSVFAGGAVIPLFSVAGLLPNGAGAWLAPDDHAVWVVNTETAAHSTYTNWEVNSMGVFNGVQLLALPDGIYEETGDEDGVTQIDAKVYWPASEFGTQMQKRIDAVYVNGRLLGNFRIVAVCDETQRRIYTQDMTNYPRNAHPKRVLFTRSLQGRYWQLGFENALGNRFSGIDIEAMPIELSRRLR